MLDDPKHHETIKRLLGDFGESRIDEATFWEQMRAHGFGQDHIDAYLETHFAAWQPTSKRAELTAQKLPRNTVVLDEAQIAEADQIAHMRRKNASGNNWRPGNNATREAKAALAMDIMGARAEAAGAVYCAPVEWHKESLRHDDPDLDTFIDAKGISQRGHSLILQPNKRDDWAYLLVDGSRHPRYEMIGWVWGHEGKQPKYWRDPVGQRGGYFIPADDPVLRPPEELLVELRKRQAARFIARSPACR